MRKLISPHPFVDTFVFKLLGAFRNEAYEQLLPIWHRARAGERYREDGSEVVDAGALDTGRAPEGVCQLLGVEFRFQRVGNFKFPLVFQNAMFELGVNLACPTLESAKGNPQVRVVLRAEFCRDRFEETFAKVHGWLGGVMDVHEAQVARVDLALDVFTDEVVRAWLERAQFVTRVRKTRGYFVPKSVEPGRINVGPLDGLQASSGWDVVDPSEDDDGRSTLLRSDGVHTVQEFTSGRYFLGWLMGTLNSDGAGQFNAYRKDLQQDMVRHSEHCGAFWDRVQPCWRAWVGGRAGKRRGGVWRFEYRLSRRVLREFFPEVHNGVKVPGRATVADFVGGGRFAQNVRGLWRYLTRDWLRVVEHDPRGDEAYRVKARVGTAMALLGEVREALALSDLKKADACTVRATAELSAAELEPEACPEDARGRPLGVTRPEERPTHPLWKMVQDAGLEPMTRAEPAPLVRCGPSEERAGEVMMAQVAGTYAAAIADKALTLETFLKSHTALGLDVWNNRLPERADKRVFGERHARMTDEQARAFAAQLLGGGPEPLPDVSPLDEAAFLDTLYGRTTGAV